MDAWKYEIHFSCSTEYRTRSLCSFVRYPLATRLQEIAPSALTLGAADEV
jgi:hypothetical protein